MPIRAWQQAPKVLRVGEVNHYIVDPKQIQPLELKGEKFKKIKIKTILAIKGRKITNTQTLKKEHSGLSKGKDKISTHGTEGK